MSDFTPVPKPAPKVKEPKPLRRKTPLPRSTKPIARASWLKPSTKKIPKQKGERRRRREKDFKKFLGSAVWKAIRLETFKVHDFTCVKCGWTDETRTGLGLVCDHLTYFRPLGQEIVGEDTRTLCGRCNAKETVAKRANWAQPRRKDR